MNCIDTLKVQFPTELITFDPEKYNKSIKYYTREKNESIMYQLQPENSILGVSNILINQSNTTLEISSKLIPDLYSEMINRNTVEKYFDTINESKIINFNRSELLNSCKVFKCDVTNNMSLNTEVCDHINFLSIYRVNNKFDCKHYLNESVIFSYDAKEKYLKERMNIYNKYPELFKAENREFIKMIDPEKFKNVLRFESRIANLKLMRKSFNIKDTNLTSVLNSDVPVNYNLFNKITNISHREIETFNEVKILFEMKTKMKLSQIRNLQGDLAIIKACNYDINIIKALLSVNSTAKNSKYIKHYRELIQSVNNINNNNTIDEKVTEIKDYLKNAA